MLIHKVLGSPGGSIERELSKRICGDLGKKIGEKNGNKELGEIIGKLLG